jgi:hypothetical protein
MSFEKLPPEWVQDRKGRVVEGMERKLNGNLDVNTRAVSREQNKLIAKFKMVAGYVISIRG